jgi:geranylgeranyl reductase family protein
MTAHSRHPVAIVGAGPAGASCAHALLLAGVNGVALIDKATFPRDKACGDGIGPGAVLVLRQLRLEHLLQFEAPIASFSVSGPSGVTASGPLPEIDGHKPAGYVIPRRHFDARLVAAALDRGAHDWTGWSLVRAHYANRKWHLTVENTASRTRQEITACYLIGADGASSRVRRLLSVPPNSEEETATALRVYARAECARPDLRLDFIASLLPGYGWAFPLKDGQVNIGVGIDLPLYKARRLHLRELLRIYAARLGPGFDYDQRGGKSFILPYGSELPRLAHPECRAALVGDAGSMINPLSGEGIFYGMAAGRLLGEKLAGIILRSADAVRSLRDYESEFRARFAAHFAANRRMKARVRVPLWCNMAVRACQKDERVLADFLAVVMGDKNDLALSTVLRALARNVLP